ncbi:hypothetical protein [Flavobacterium panici]|uniref:Uncharacterized protein n=1 Tax=Flavobacterium panici TaxID=2654843 RepID=A0A9N8J4Y1_9FLAO|nr:hypothetical protein [Flavobacterium panici]CAC9976295.1 hypothetical protein FLAPXU55_04019 [Flavobacterium panici]
MSGYYNYYKVDKNKTSVTLLSKLNDIKLQPKQLYHFKDKQITNFRDYVIEITQNSIFTKISFEQLIFKVKTDFYKINPSEFEAIMDWVHKYYNDNEDIDKFLIELGLEEIESFNTKFENDLFFFGINGINNYYSTIKKDNFWKELDTLSNAEEMNLVLDFLTFLMIKFIISNTETNTKEQFELINKLENAEGKTELKEAACLFFETLKDMNSDYSKMYSDSIHYFSQNAESLLSKIEDFQAGIANYNGVIFIEACF